MALKDVAVLYGVSHERIRKVRTSLQAKQHSLTIPSCMLCLPDSG